MAGDFRIERDSMGELAVPATALWGAQTQRALENFNISSLRMPRTFIRALALIKWAAAVAHRELQLLDAPLAQAIEQSALAIAAGEHDAEFPLDVFQTGSGTSTNMNANEVIAHLASHALGRAVHANDHVNLGQSSNDVIPAAIHLAALLGLEEQLKPALRYLAQHIERRIGEIGHIVKTGRTHLMDAVPLTLGQELSGWRTQIEHGNARLEAAEVRLRELAVGGTAVGTGLNAHPQLGSRVAAHLSAHLQMELRPSGNYFAALASQDVAVEVSGQLKTVAVSLLKIANDLRWMNSGPLSGLGEIRLSTLQPGSSIMPGKVNPVIPEAVAMVAAQVIGNDATITMAGQSGQFQLNVMLPLIAYNLCQSIELLAAAARRLADAAIADFTVNEARLRAALDRSPMLVTALNPVIGYERGAAIAKQAYAQDRAIRDVAGEVTGLSAAKLGVLLDPARLTRGGLLAEPGDDEGGNPGGGQ